uniref:Calmodulin-binding domain-containing protein n=1 Tax=Arundo donax TaxID=35708 RepID=A0A0A9D0C9_ARUDO
MGAKNSLSIQRTRSVPARQTEAPKNEEQEVDLLMEFDEMESISTPSIEEHLQERLPDPVELKPMDLITYATSEDAPSEPSSNQEEYKNEEVTEHISEEKYEEKDNADQNGDDNADVGINNEVNAMREAVSENDLKEAVDENELSEAIGESGLKEAVDETKLNEAVSETEIKEAIDETKLNKAGCGSELKKAVNETEIKDAISEPELIVKEEVEFKEEKIMPSMKTLELVHRWRKDDERSNEVTEGRSKPMQERKNKVMALIGKFETVMSNRE